MAGQTSFADFYSLEDLEQYKAVDEAWPKTDEGNLVTSGPVYDAWRPTRMATDDRLEEAFRDFLRTKIAAGELQPIPFAKGRNHSFADEWNRMVGAIPDEVDRGHDTEFWRKLSLDRMAVRLAGTTGIECVRRSYVDLIAQVNAGTFEHFFLDSSGQCTRTGIRLQADIVGWKARLGTVDRRPRSQGGTGAVIPLSEDAPGAAVHHLTIPVPSGQLLLADWFRIPEFTSVVEVKRDEFDINLAIGRVAQTRHYAQDHGFASVFVGNSSPSIVSRDGTLAIGNALDPDEGFDRGGSQGYICTDLWWATAIDRQVLEAIVARGLIAASADAGAEALSQADAAAQAQDKVREYLRKNTLTQLDLRAMGLPPGQNQQGEPVLNLYFSDANDRLTQFRADYVHTQDFDPLSLVLSPRELVWRNRDVDVERDNERDAGERPVCRG